jgi:hypothetical protein
MHQLQGSQAVLHGFDEFNVKAVKFLRYPLNFGRDLSYRFSVMDQQ